MSKKNLKLLLALVVIILMVVLSYFYLGNKPSAGVVKDTGGGDNFFADLLNFANFTKQDDGNTQNDQSDGSGEEDSNGQVIEPTKLVKISSMPIAGYAVFDQERFVDVAAPKKEEVLVQEGETKTPPVKINTRPVAPATERIPVLRYVSKENGNIFQTFVDKPNERKFSDNLIPGVHEAFFGNNGESVILRYLNQSDTILTWSGTLPKEVIGADSTAPNKLLGHFLLENITDMSISPDTKKIFYIFNSQNGAIGVSAAPEGDKRVQVYSGAYTEWLSQWPADDVITLTTKPSARIPGYMYEIGVAGKTFVKVLGGINGLTTLTSPDKENVLYSDSLLSLSVHNTKTNETKNLSVRTLPEKCVWAKGGSLVYCAVPKFINGAYPYPDSWYQGEVAFSDDIWKIDVSTGASELLIDPAKDGGGRNFQPIDAVRLSLSSDNKHLFFMNKNDSYLWGLDLN